MFILWGLYLELVREPLCLGEVFAETESPTDVTIPKAFISYDKYDKCFFLKS